MSIRTGLFRTLLLCALFAVAGCSTRTLKTLPAQPVPAGMSDAQVATAIKAALQSRHWQVIGEKPGHIEAQVGKGSDLSLTTDVSYGASGVLINYVDSRGLDYEESDGQARIHKHYYRWVKYLRKSIHAQLRHEQEAPDGAEDDSQE